MSSNIKNSSVPIGGTEMSYVSFGSGEKAVIFIHGLPGSFHGQSVFIVQK